MKTFSNKLIVIGDFATLNDDWKWDINRLKRVQFHKWCHNEYKRASWNGSFEFGSEISEFRTKNILAYIIHLMGCKNQLKNVTTQSSSSNSNIRYQYSRLFSTTQKESFRLSKISVEVFSTWIVWSTWIVTEYLKLFLRFSSSTISYSFFNLFILYYLNCSPLSHQWILYPILLTTGFP